MIPMKHSRRAARWPSRLWPLVLALTLFSSPGVAKAEGEADEQFLLADYDATSQAWNGLYTLIAVAKGLGLSVEAVDNIDWEDLGANDIVFILYPSGRLEPGHIAGFVRSGGRILVADDFGQSKEALARLGMLRERAVGVNASKFYRGLQYVPMAQPLAPEHPLAAGITELATNHPSVLTDVIGPDVVFGFSPSEAVVVAGDLGDGRFVVCSDPSIFINRMMQFQGNLDFAINTLRYLGRGNSTRLIILANDFSLYGEPTARLDDGTVRGNLATMLGDFNRWLEERNDYLLTEPGMRAVGVILAGLAGLIALLCLPLIRKSLMEGAWTRARSSNIPLDDFDEILSRYDRSDKISNKTNFLLAATVLRDAVNNLLARVLETPDPLYNLTEEAIGEGLVMKRGRLAMTTFAALHKKVKPLPSRAQAASPWSTGFMSKRDFDRLYDDAVELYLALGEELG
jgi:hypothetical protein